MTTLDWFMDPFRDLAHRWQAQRDPGGLAFDRRHGTETRSFDWLGNYEPTRPQVVTAVLDALDLDPTQWTLADLGSGKGRAVLLAAKRPFREVIGVEQRAVLHRRAQANLAAARARRTLACPVRLVHGDAARFSPPDGPLVLFLYNPFGPGVLGRALAHLDPRQAVRIAYVTPRHAALVESHGFREIRRGGSAIQSWRVYAR